MANKRGYSHIDKEPFYLHTQAEGLSLYLEIFPQLQLFYWQCMQKQTEKNSTMCQKYHSHLSKILYGNIGFKRARGTRVASCQSVTVIRLSWRKFIWKEYKTRFGINEKVLYTIIFTRIVSKKSLFDSNRSVRKRSTSHTIITYSFQHNEELPTVLRQIHSLRVPVKGYCVHPTTASVSIMHKFLALFWSLGLFTVEMRKLTDS